MSSNATGDAQPEPAVTGEPAEGAGTAVVAAAEPAVTAAAEPAVTAAAEPADGQPGDVAAASIVPAQAGGTEDDPNPQPGAVAVPGEDAEPGSAESAQGGEPGDGEPEGSGQEGTEADDADGEPPTSPSR